MFDIESYLIETANWNEIPVDEFKKYVRENILYELKIMSKDYWEQKIAEQKPIMEKKS